MKKLFTIMIITMSMLLTGCSSSQKELSSEEVFQKYLDAVEKINTANSYTASANVDANIKDIASGEVIEIATQNNIKMQNINQSDMLMSIALTSKFGDMIGQQNIYYADGFAYIDYDGYKVKSVMNIDDILLQATQSNNNYFTTYKSLSYSVVDGDYIIYFTLNDDQMTQMINDTGLGIQMTVENIVSMNNKAVVTSDGYLKQIYVSIQTKYSELNQEYEFNITSDFIYSDYDTTVVTLPDDLDQYIEE